MTIKDLNPSLVWNNFYNITRYPRPSKHEEKIRQYLLQWGKDHNLETFADETGNVIIRIPATPGYEDHTGVILQGHMDMVPQKNSDVEHDFEHGPIEILITYDEETGMTGANALKPGILKGSTLINLDSETEGELYVGCAGGVDATAKASYGMKACPEGFKCWSLKVKGCQGGHSGMDIILYRANANRIAARLLHVLMKETDAKLVDMEGGTLRNAIPRECFSTVLVKDVPLAQAVIDNAVKAVRSEYAQTDPDMQVIFEPCECGQKMYVEEDKALRFVEAVLACPDGVERMSASIPGLVETSNNLAIVRIGDGQFLMHTLMRSSVDTAKAALQHRFAAVMDLAGAEASFEGGYSGWAPNPDSKILAVMKKVYLDMFGKEPEVMAIHAGLECGILGGIYPDWDMVSIGPTLKSPHSPDERCYIPSVQKVYDFLKEVLASI